jgi:hypothetical protein
MENFIHIEWLFCFSLLFFGNGNCFIHQFFMHNKLAQRRNTLLFTLLSLIHPRQGGMIAVQRDSEPLLSTAINALTEIFRPQTPFLTASVMDILFNGIPINCAVDDFAAKSLCSRIEDEKPIRIVNDTHLAFSLFSGVSDL